ncbi:MAG: hypothetical protein RL747_1708, partial [Bacteroidota bacterium]
AVFEFGSTQIGRCMEAFKQDGVIIEQQVAHEFFAIPCGNYVGFRSPEGVYPAAAVVVVRFFC